MRPWGWLLVLVLLSAFLRFTLFPPISFSEGAYFFLAPLLLWNWQGHSRKAIFGWGWLAGFLFWVASIVWLRHVTLIGMIGLSGVLALFMGVWSLVFGRWLQPRWAGKDTFTGSWFVPLVGAAVWVLLEWTRSWIFWGFPWNPVSLSQWNRPAVLSIVSATGGWGLTFLLIWINLALVQWLRTPFTEWKSKGFLPVARKVPIVLVVPIGILMVSAGSYFWQSMKREPSEPVRVGFVQPYSTMKWDQSAVSRNIENLWQETRSLQGEDPEIILWPEASTPIPVIGEYSIRTGVEALASGMKAPILMGNMASYREKGIYENGVFLVEPDGGLVADYYVKRELVPFGEFVPFREIFPFLEKVVPIGLDCRPGERPVLFPFPSADGQDKVGPLVCYEDVFPSLARDTTQAGADWLFVATNNVWYGEEAGAYQHAAHAVVRAVENRRPVLRSGNAGWSGWIDEWGHIRKRVSDENGSIYFRGAETVSVNRDLRFDGVMTPYARFGDWIVALAAGILGAGLLSSWKRKRS
ncbi:apolipoprotein N-acyltransferase [Puniceicoccus vermicola]|uniref:Apolipoprotein N-acyltransferase n=1 Tax=Puniceicoccus vermicola TaxID=388746 RepID=A0A7X1E4L9_9BACT|nr:apolipoprotein N-acyltransferase [Puniceicoccus vermicola]MBC2602194.1 apolipoprotein N-acyltransferase [Puniceicoccus vermicola]